MTRWIAGSSAAPAPPIIVRQARIRSGGFNPLPNTSGAWQALAGYELAIPAAVGEWVEASADFLMVTGGAGFLDVAVIVGSSLVRYGGSGTGVAAIEGNPGWYPASGFSPGAGAMGFIVTEDDLDDGEVRFVLACKSNGTGRLYADDSYPFRWRAVNLRTVS